MCLEVVFSFRTDTKEWAMKKTTVVMAARDEADALADLMPCVLGALMETGAEIVVVDDGSVDGTGDIARFFGVPVLRQSGLGKPQAVQRGFQHALEQGAEAVVVFDCDGQHPPTALPQILRLLDAGHQVVKGTRFHEASAQAGTPPDRLELCRQVRESLDRFTGWGITDPQCGLIGLQRPIVELLLPRLTWSVEWEIEAVLTLRQVFSINGSPILELPIPALYQGLPGHKQVAKYDPAKGAERLAERLGRQLEVVRLTAERLGLSRL